MKRTLFTLAAIFAVLTPARADFITKTTQDAVEVSASGTDTSDAYNLGTLAARQNKRLEPKGYFAAQITVTGSGTVKVEYLCSNDGVTYTEPEGAVDIISGMTAGTKYVSFQPPLSKYQKIKVTETGGANSATVTVILCIQ